ncbi:MAG TPA: hypothetical protein VMT85_16670 [Thermoanaerobaculia bacterium]|nr:hypothetical protein [Thermoanaerobaculia bacterium]
MGDIVLIALLLLVGPQDLAPAGTEAAAVEAVFERYKQALVAGDGATAQALVDAQTLQTFERLRELALGGSQEEVRGLSFIERLLVVSMRHALEREEIETMDLAALIETAMGEGWIAPQTLAQLDIGEIVVEGDRARGEAISGLQPPASGQSADAEVELYYRFVREEGEWKFQFASLIETLDALVAELTAALGTDEDQLIFMLVESFTGRRVLPEVWSTPPDGGGDG